VSWTINRTLKITFEDKSLESQLQIYNPNLRQKQFYLKKHQDELYASNILSTKNHFCLLKSESKHAPGELGESGSPGIRLASRLKQH